VASITNHRQEYSLASADSLICLTASFWDYVISYWKSKYFSMDWKEQIWIYCLLRAGFQWFP
jgi:hypothetical protein